jgi:hypothetical protein
MHAQKGQEEEEWRFCPQTNHQYRIAVGSRVERAIATTRKLRLEDELVMEGEFPVRKFSTRKWSGSGQEMATIIWSHLFDALFFRISRESWEVAGRILPCWSTAESKISVVLSRRQMISSPMNFDKNVTTRMFT